MASTQRQSDLDRAPLEIGFYGEFDPFGGDIRCHPDDLPRLVRELSNFLLVKDIVIFSPGPMLEHTLALPACEHLAPFVRTGRLTTTASPTLPNPAALVRRNAERHAESLLPLARLGGARSKTTRIHQAEIAAIVDRWQAIVSDRWSLTRDVGGQVSQFARGILTFSKGIDKPSRAMMTLRSAVEDSIGIGHPINRSQVLRHMVAQRSNTTRSELAQLLFVTQMMFFKFGVESHTSCSLYPGSFARLVHQIGPSATQFALPAIDWKATPAYVEARLRDIGLSSRALFQLPVEVLADIVASPEWRVLRGHLRGVALAPELLAEFRHLFEANRDPSVALSRVFETTDARAPVPRLFSRWQLVAIATLGVSAAPRPEQACPTFDLSTYALEAPGVPRRQLTLAKARLLTALAVGGDAGIGVDDLEQFVFDLERTADAEPRTWRPKPATPVELAKARAQTVRTQVSRLNKDLAPFALWVRARDGRYRLHDKLEQGRELQVRGSVWEQLGDNELPEPPEGLSSSQATLWRRAAQCMPQPISVSQAAISLDKPLDEAGKHQAGEALTRLSDKLVELGSAWRLVRVGGKSLWVLLP